MSVSILDNWIEGASSAILVDSLLPGSTVVFINGLTVENNTYANPTAQFPEYPNPRFLRVTHGDITKGVSILGAVFERNVVSVETSSYAVQFSYATSTAPSNDNAVIYWKNNHLWGATTSGVYSDSNKVATHSRNNDARSSWYGATVAVVSGSGFYTDVLDANGITNHKTEVDFTGPVYINNGTGLLQLEGTAESFLSLFVNGGRSFSSSSNLSYLFALNNLHSLF